MSMRAMEGGGLQNIYSCGQGISLMLLGPTPGTAESGGDKVWPKAVVLFVPFYWSRDVMQRNLWYCNNPGL